MKKHAFLTYNKVSLICLILCAHIGSAIANESDEHARWFDVEVIVYKSMKNINLSKEAWRTDIKFEKSEKIIDLIQPQPVQENLLIEKTSPHSDTQQATAINSQSYSINSNASPFLLLDKNELHLNNEVKSLTRHPNYQVVAHYGWRQPIYNAKKAQSIRVAGGRDYSKIYDYDGNKLPSELSNDTTSINDEYGNEPNRLSTEYISTDYSPFDKETTKITNLPAYENEMDNNGTHTSEPPPNDTLSLSDSELSVSKPEPTKIAWVPELDGDIFIYLNRYLHIKTNLYLRMPGKEEIEIIELDNYNDALSVDQNPPKNNNASSKSKSSQFSWEINDDFLESESEKRYIERLFNYPMKQSRRLRSGELHYFDHPLMGLLVIIRPYKLKKP